MRIIQFKKIRLIVSLLLISLSFFTCNTKKEVALDINVLITKYSKNPSDSLRLQCAKFLKDNMHDLTSDKSTFYNFISGEEVNISLDSIQGDSALLKILQQNNFTRKSIKVYDTSFLTNEILEKNIDDAIASWNKYPWSKNVPKNIFLNFLLPYKILDENPEEWRQYFYEKYKDSIGQRLRKYFKDTSNIYYKDPNDVYYQIIVDDVGKWFHYNLTFTKLNQVPSLGELLCIKEGDCLQSAYLSTYILRSFGIPAAIDIVPIWGSRNAGHASEVFWDGESRMRAASGRSFDKPAKVFRMSFKVQNIWKDSILPFVGNAPFRLPYLQNNHWLDVTAEHNFTTDIYYNLLPNVNVPFSYICVYNYGEWQPIYWGRIEKNNTAVFKNMGCNMLYRIAVPQGEDYKIISPVLRVDSSGNLFYQIPDNDMLQNLRLRKLNTGNRSWIKKDKSYSLYLLDKKNNWEILETQTCLRDSVITFKNVPSKAFYRLLDVNSDHKLERIFTYEASMINFHTQGDENGRNPNFVSH